jgi:CheY-like chemotaxis protein
MMREQHQRVLVVDDDHVIRQILVAALQQQPLLTIDEARDGTEAIRLLRENSYTVILLDLLMPGESGFDVLNAIDGSPADPPIVLVVTGADRNIVDQLDSRKIHGIIRKPFDPREIAGVVAACSEIRGRSAFETMALATMIGGAPLIALLKL